MPDKRNEWRYVVITPVKDEAGNVRKTLDSMVSQEIKPLKWVIVDDGSTDSTAEIVRPYAGKYPWIELLSNAKASLRNTGTAEVAAFKKGLEAVSGLDYDYLVKLDADVEFDRDYFSKVLSKFEEEPRLGIASGVYAENRNGTWNEVPMPDYHAAGASKVVRRECFEQIGGFLSTPGWDTVDEIKALYLGWKTAHFKDALFHHLKPEGSGMGFLSTNFMHGEIYYLTGGGKIFFLLKFVHRFFLGRPFMLGGLAMLLGYARAALGKKTLVNKEEARFYRRLVNGRLLGGLKAWR